MERFFGKYANLLLLEKNLSVDVHILEILEIEFYYRSKRHPDPFVHCHPDQLTSKRWYFHKQRSSFRSGTYKGLDLTFGPSDRHGGILIRSVLCNGKVIEGPCRVVNFILELLKLERIDDLVKFEEHPLNVRGGRLKLLPKEKPLEQDFSRSPRVGLTLKTFTEAKFEYLMKPYRYIRKDMEPHIKKYARLVFLSNINWDKPTLMQIGRHADWFREGQEMDVKEIPVKLSRVEDLCKMYGCWWANWV